MLKWLAIFAILAGALPAAPPMPWQTVKPSAEGGSRADNRGQANQHPPDQPTGMKQEQPITSNQHASTVPPEDKEHSSGLTSLPPVTLTEKSRAFWDYVFDWGPWAFNFGLLVVGAFQVWLLFRTWRTIHRQAEIQEAGMTQWIDMKPNGIRVETKSKSEPPDKVTINLHWKIVNNTPYPFTLKRIETKVCRARDWVCSGTNPDEVLAPRGETEHNFYVFFVPLDLTKSQTKTFLDKGIALSIATRVSYIQVNGQLKHQFFGEMYQCTLTTMEINESLGQGPAEQWGEKDDGPGTIRVRTVKVMMDDGQPTVESPPESEEPN